MSLTGVLSALIVREAGIDARVIESALPAGSSSRTVDLALSPDSILATLSETEPDLLVVATTEASDRALEMIRVARDRLPECAVVVVASDSPNGFMQQAFRLGADDLLGLSVPREGIAFAFEKAIARRRGAAPSGAEGRMICIVGPKGGTGKTLTACNLAVALALRGRSTALVDVDLQFGDVGIALGLKPERTIHDLAVSPGLLDDDKVERYLVAHGSGARALLAPIRPDQAQAIGPDLLRNVYGALRHRFDYVIVDTPPSFSPEVIASIDAASDLLVVGMLDALSLKDTKIGLETLALMGYAPSTVKLVLNRADTSVGISLDDVEAILGRRPDVFVPSDRAVPRAITRGLPIVTADERSGPARAFSSLADLYLEPGPQASTSRGNSGAVEGAGVAGRRSLLRRR